MQWRFQFIENVIPVCVSEIVEEINPFKRNNFQSIRRIKIILYFVTNWYIIYDFLASIQALITFEGVMPLDYVIQIISHSAHCLQIVNRLVSEWRYAFKSEEV